MIIMVLLAGILLGGRLPITTSHASTPTLSLYPDFATSYSTTPYCTDFTDYNGYPTGSLATASPTTVDSGPLDQEYSYGNGASFCSYSASTSFTPSSASATLYLVEHQPETFWNVSVLLIDLSNCVEIVYANDCAIVAQGSINVVTNIPYSDQSQACGVSQPFQVDLNVVGSVVSGHELGVEINATETPNYLADELQLCTGPMGDGGSTVLNLFSAAPPSTAKIPFAGTLKGLQMPDPSFSCPPQCISVNSFASVGTYSYIGGATFSGAIISDWSKFGSSQMCASVNIQGVITASDGSNLALSGSGVQCKIFAGATYTGTNSLAVGYKLSGGSGKFLGDTGYGLLVEKVVVKSGTLSGNLLGIVAHSGNS